MLKRLLLPFVGMLALFADPAAAQVQLAPGGVCSSTTIVTPTGPTFFTVDGKGELCVSGTGGGGGGGAITAAAGSYASGAFSAGAFAAGSVASGAFAVGAGSDGWDGTEGAKADAACGTDNGTCTLVALTKRTNQNITTLNTTAGGPVNNVAASGADPCFGSLKSNFAISTAAGTTALVTGVSAKKIYVCSFLIVAGGTAAVSLAEGSSATCGTSLQAAVIGVSTAVSASGGVPLVANAGWQMGSGNGTVAQTANNANYLCLFQSATAQLSGNITYVQQ